MTKVEELQVIISANADQFKGQLTSIQKELAGLGKSTTASSSAIGGVMFGAVTKANIALMLLTGALSILGDGMKAVENVIEDSITANRKYETSLIGLEAVASRKLGMQGMKDATQTAKDLVTDGLMPVENAATGLKNLLASGFSLKEATDLMLVFKDSAAFGKQEALTFGQAVSSATEGIKNGNSILVDNAGITKNLSNILKDAGYAEQDLARATTDAGVRQAIYNGLLQEGNLFQGNAAILANTSAGQIQAIEARLTTLRVTIGQFLEPIQQVIQGGLLSFLNGVQLTFNGAKVGVEEFAVQVAAALLAIIRMIGRLLSSIPIIGQNFVGMANLTIGVSKTQNNLSNSLNNTNTAMKKVSSSAGKLKSDLMGLASFDEMNVLTAGAGANGAGGAGGINVPNINMDQFKSSLDSIDWNRINGLADGVVKNFEKTLEPIGNFIKKLQTAKDSAYTTSDSLGALGSSILYAIPIVGQLALAYDTLSIAYTFLYQNSEEFRKLIDEKVTPVINAFKKQVTDTTDSIKKSFVDTFQNTITPILNGIIDFIGGLVIPVFKNVSLVIGMVVGEIVKKFNEVKKSVQEALDPVVEKFNLFKTWLGVNIMVALNEFIGNWKLVWMVVSLIVSNIWDGIKQGIKDAINWIIDKLNIFINKVNGVVKTINGMGAGIPGWTNITWTAKTIPQLAQGGIVNSPTVAMIGEAGREAVVPLENTKWIDELASKINNSSNGQGGNITIKLGEEKIYSKFIDYVNDRSKATNSLVFNI
jgi:hypothetical protein